MRQSGEGKQQVPCQRRSGRRQPSLAARRPGTICRAAGEASKRSRVHDGDRRRWPADRHRAVASRPAAKSGFFVPSEAAGPGQADAAAAPAATLARLDAGLAGGWAARPSRTARRAGTATTCSPRWRSCSGRCWAAATMRRRCSGWRILRPRCRMPPIRGWPPWCRRSSCGSGWSWRAGSLSGIRCMSAC